MQVDVSATVIQILWGIVKLATTTLSRVDFAYNPFKNFNDLRLSFVSELTINVSKDGKSSKMWRNRVQLIEDEEFEVPECIEDRDIGLIFFVDLNPDVCSTSGSGSSSNSSRGGGGSGGYKCCC